MAGHHSTGKLSIVNSIRNAYVSRACQSGNFYAIKFLLKADADPFQQDNRGWTPRHVAILYGRRNVLPTLVKRVRKDTSDVDNAANESDDRMAPLDPFWMKESKQDLPANKNEPESGDDKECDVSEQHLRPGQRHYVLCNSCEMLPHGLRFKCRLCRDFNLCFKVYSLLRPEVNHLSIVTNQSTCSVIGMCQRFTTHTMGLEDWDLVQTKARFHIKLKRMMIQRMCLGLTELNVIGKQVRRM